jgi:hypothetical protein
MSELPPADQLLASAVRYLIDGEEERAANVLLSCSAEFREGPREHGTDGLMYRAIIVELRGPRAAVETLSNQEHPIRESIHQAIWAVLPSWCYLREMFVTAELVDLDPNWRTELLEIARGNRVSNQASTAKAPRVWQNLRFRSESEVRIAKALDRAGVLFWANCRARLGGDGNRQNKEADFLVCHQGNFGILEVDGEPFHPPARTVHDHERNRLFKAHGIRVCEHFDASECFERGDEIVAEFLRILAAS